MVLNELRTAWNWLSLSVYIIHEKVNWKHESKHDVMSCYVFINTGGKHIETSSTENIRLNFTDLTVNPDNQWAYCFIWSLEP